MHRSSLVRTSAAALALGVVGCHNHDSTSSGTSSTLRFSLSSEDVREGESTIVTAFRTTGEPPEIVGWDLASGPPGAQLIDTGVPDTVRYVGPHTVSGPSDTYRVRGTSAQGDRNGHNFSVTNSTLTIRVDQALVGDDDDIVEASLAAGGILGTQRMYIAERVGDAGAPQILTWLERDGSREGVYPNGVGITTPFKIEDLGADNQLNVTAIRTEATLTDALVRYDSTLMEDTTFSAPDLAGANWRELVAMTRNPAPGGATAGDTIVVTDIDGGRLLRLAADGTPYNGDIPSSVLPLPLPFADIVDIATDVDDAVYVATATQIARVGADGVVDMTNWNVAPMTAIRGIAADDRGILWAIAQDADAGQCGSLHRLDWTGSQVRRVTSFEDPVQEFAARKIIDPLALGVFRDGDWRIHDDIVTLNPASPRAAWILAGRYGE